jgi:hypothetical protein
MDFEDKFPHPNETHKSGPIKRMAQLRPFHQKGIDAATRRFRFGAAQRSFSYLRHSPVSSMTQNCSSTC